MYVAEEKYSKMCVSESRLVLVSLLIGRQSGTSFLSQSLSVVMQNHSKYELLLTLNARENSALLCHWGTRKLCLASHKITCMAAMLVYWHVTGNDEIFVVLSEGVLLKKQQGHPTAIFGKYLFGRRFET